MSEKFVCTEETLKPGVTQWGVEVKCRMARRSMSQTALAKMLREEGIEVWGRDYVSELLNKGQGALTTRRKAVSAINRILDIPEDL